jgi:baculoviral IAP repeat-containing protein 7/8
MERKREALKIYEKSQLRFAGTHRDMNCEYNRIRTFTDEFPHCRAFAEDLAKFGFCYIGPSDTVRCNFCCIIIYDFEPGDTALGEHWKWSPDCSLLVGRKTLNEPLHEDPMYRKTR